MELIRSLSGFGEGIKINSCPIGPGQSLEYLTFPALERLGMVKHLVTTRSGGVSRGEFSTMNLSFTRGDSEEAVRENYRRIGHVLGCAPEDMTASRQTHTTNIRRVTGEDRGKGITRPADYQDVDGLMTDEPGLGLVTYYADCVPLLFADPVHRAIGAAHSGWRGTADRMGRCMVQEMERAFGSKPEQIWAAIGPSICQSCYEVGEDVARYFRELDSETERTRRRIPEESRWRRGREGNVPRVVEPGRVPGKYQLDLWLANYLILTDAGILPEHISVTDVCTCCNSKELFSHRASGGRRGNLAAFMMLCPLGEAD